MIQLRLVLEMVECSFDDFDYSKSVFFVVEIFFLKTGLGTNDSFLSRWAFV